ncbi:MAG TPA: ETC complex I subunit [Candidatus Cybelea sp.]|nr:ETC complex I subunit [Candidatus Cybelea sp.]
MAVARIFRPTKTAMQSGRGQTKAWTLAFDPAEARFIEPLMGWTGSRDTAGQVQIDFDTLDAAVAFAAKHGIPYEVEQARSRHPRRQAYADNFSYHRPK